MDEGFCGGRRRRAESAGDVGGKQAVEVFCVICVWMRRRLNMNEIFFGVSQGVEYRLLCGGCGWSRIFNVKIKRKRKETKNTMALETEALSISSVLKMITITNQILGFYLYYSYYSKSFPMSNLDLLKIFKFLPQTTGSI